MKLRIAFATLVVAVSLALPATALAVDAPVTLDGAFLMDKSTIDVHLTIGCPPNYIRGWAEISVTVEQRDSVGTATRPEIGCSGEFLTIGSIDPLTGDPIPGTGLLAVGGPFHGGWLDSVLVTGYVCGINGSFEQQVCWDVNQTFTRVKLSH